MKLQYHVTPMKSFFIKTETLLLAILWPPGSRLWLLAWWFSTSKGQLPHRVWNHRMSLPKQLPLLYSSVLLINGMKKNVAEGEGQAIRIPTAKLKFPRLEEEWRESNQNQSYLRSSGKFFTVSDNLSSGVGPMCFIYTGVKTITYQDVSPSLSWQTMWKCRFTFLEILTSVLDHVTNSPGLNATSEYC